MTSYIRFCACQGRACQILQKKKEDHADFELVHKKCVADPRCGGMPLSSFLLKPTQRITRYPLLLKNVSIRKRSQLIYLYLRLRLNGERDNKSLWISGTINNSIIPSLLFSLLQILNFTPVGHPDRLYLEEAVTKAEELCSQVNEGVREKENSDTLEWIQLHVNCDTLSERFTFNSLTNLLGPRKYVHHGPLNKVIIPSENYNVRALA
jgi:hypothetical protein